MTALSGKMQQRRDTAASWTSNNPTLAAGEMGWESDTGEFKIGDGSTAWTSLSYWPPLTSTRPRGWLGLHTLTTAFTTSSTHTNFQDEGLTLTINEPAGRRLKISFLVRPYCSGGAAVPVSYRLLRAGSAISDYVTPFEALATGTSFARLYSYVLANSAGGASTTWKLQFKAVTGSSAVSSYGASDEPRQLWIEDMGVGA